MMILIKTRLQSASACPVEGIKRHLPNMEYQPLIATGLRASETVAEPEGKTFIVDRKKIDTDLELNTITWRRIVLPLAPSAQVFCLNTSGHRGEETFSAFGNVVDTSLLV